MSERHAEWAPEDEPPVSGTGGGASESERTSGSTPFVLGIIGDSGSGKNTVADAVGSLLGSARVTELSLDDYHRYTREERAELGLTPLNPRVHDLSLMQEHLKLLRQRRPIRTRTYQHENGTFGAVRTVEPRDIVLARGLLGFPTQELQELYDLAVFLQPESELLFRWKLRRDVLFRGYKESDVLKSIASHLLDAKEFVLPQADRADCLVYYDLPHWDAPDSEVMTTIRFRRRAADLLDAGAAVAKLPVEQTVEGSDIVIRVPPDIAEDAVDSWGMLLFPESFSGAATGMYHDQDGVPRRRVSLAFVELLIAGLGKAMLETPPT